MPAYEALSQAIIAGDGSTALALTNAALTEGAAAREILDDGLLPGMDEVGRRMKAGECFIPEVLLSARTMQSCLDLLKPLLAAGESSSLGTIIIGTVEGDVHDIGKNLVAMLLEGAGFEVYNLGTGITAAAFVAAAKEHKADIVGMSALLTTTMPRMKDTIEALTDAGLRDKVKVIVGGAPITEQYADEIGADGMGANAVLAVDRVKELVAGARM
jgi:5-methyltetrahydrofolate--homocysteine methyltransferase